MSYNCTTFKVKKLENLRIPMASFYKSQRRDWHPSRSIRDDGTIELAIMESSFITGYLDNDILNVKSIECSGEGSGSAMNIILEPALKDSTGELIVSCVWEGGESIDQLIVKNGDIEWKPIDV